MPENASVVVFIVGLIAIAILYRVVFVRALDALCAREGWRRASADEHEQLARARDGGGVFDVVAGTTDGVRFLAGAREWTTGTGKGRSTHHERLAMLELSGPLPRLLAEHTGRLQEAILGAFREDLEITDDPDFSARWRITADDPVAAQAVLARPVRAALSDTKGGIRIDGARLAWWRPGRILWPTGYRALVRDAATVHRAIEDVLAEARMSPGGLPTAGPSDAPVPAPPPPLAVADLVATRLLGTDGGLRRGLLGAVGAGLALMAGLVAGVGGYAIADAMSRGSGDDDWWRHTLTVTGIAAVTFVAGIAMLWRSRRA